mmetsp:Transcript_99967/g.137569  ORF Transcript_99967/g.137569 Transcript_99967/m.137569 type:complete len:260 (+) Transcript_99967:170-949(+)
MPTPTKTPESAASSFSASSASSSSDARPSSSCSAAPSTPRPSSTASSASPACEPISDCSASPSSTALSSKRLPCFTPLVVTVQKLSPSPQLVTTSVTSVTMSSRVAILQVAAFKLSLHILMVMVPPFLNLPGGRLAMILRAANSALGTSSAAVWSPQAPSLSVTVALQSPQSDTRTFISPDMGTVASSSSCSPSCSPSWYWSSACPRRRSHWFGLFASNFIAKSRIVVWSRRRPHWPPPAVSVRIAARKPGRESVLGAA